MRQLLALVSLACLQQEVGQLRWPLGPGDKGYPLRATYGQLEGDEADWWFPHLGLDIVGNVAQQTVRAIEAGTVVKVKRNSAEFSGVLVESKAVQGRAFLYLHLDKTSIDVRKGDEVKVGDRLGRIAKKNSGTAEPHLHLSRLGGDYLGQDWYELPELSEGNPLVLLRNVDNGDDQEPTIVPHSGSKYVVLREDDALGIYLGGDAAGPLAMEGASGSWLDVVVNVHDTDPESTHRLAPYKLSLEIRTGENTIAFRPIVLDGALPLDQVEGLYNFSGECPSRGDTMTQKYDYCFILTNTGYEDESMRAWRATSGEHVFHIEIQDVAGNTRKLDEIITIP